MMVRKIDELGRFRIPEKLFMELGFSNFQEFEVTVEYGKICIRNFERCMLQERPYIGIIRKLDKLHRIVIPKSYLDILEIEQESKVNVTSDANTVLLMKI